MNTLDVLLLLAAVWFAVVGYRQGFVVGLLSVAGFLTGGLFAAWAVPAAWGELSGGARPGTLGLVAAAVLVIGCASVGQALTTLAGNRLRQRITWSPARALDATGGALVNVLAMLLVAWLVGAALATTTLPTIGREVRGSRVLLGVSRVVPEDAGTWFSGFGSVLAQHGFPQVFSPFGSEPITPVEPPDPGLADSPAAERARESVVRVAGTAPDCGKVLEGSGFVFAEERVMTNAHVVGGVAEPTVQVGGAGRTYDARVVLYDWERDVAVLHVPGLDAPALKFSGEDAGTGDDAIVVGFPRSGPYAAGPARVRERFEANGPDIYRRGTVSRDVYSLHATVRPGNSGGPLLTPDGEVYGVVFAKSLDDPSTGYALTYDEVRGLAARGRTADEPVDSQNCAM
ncbi:MarP family serine protease [Streptomyces sp. 7-21]|uniref:MarP family serine protease n=1 Tax=Streptomyces sp. 7-21 TaxID=2802283 RepID=UPI00191FE3A9|nr:MarP family serine protease [Streptomyces sp. 7-21]MBL1067831.1 MarP family serine protease [Streptomyces sp. 7-21]